MLYFNALGSIKLVYLYIYILSPFFCIEVNVQGQESKWSCICVIGLYIKKNVDIKFSAHNAFLE